MFSSTKKPVKLLSLQEDQSDLLCNENLEVQHVSLSNEVNLQNG